MKSWGRAAFILGAFWLLARWIGIGPFFVPSLRTAVLYAAVILALYLGWRDGRRLLIRIGLIEERSALAILDRRLARGEIDLQIYRAMRAELLAPAGFERRNKNTEPVSNDDGSA